MKRASFAPFASFIPSAAPAARVAPVARAPALLAAIASLLLAACGSRSSLRDAETNPSGEGGSAATTDTPSPSTSSATATGTVTATSTITTTTTTTVPPDVSCDRFEIETAYARVGGGTGFDQSTPVLVPTSADGQRVTLVSAWYPNASPPPDPISLRHTSFLGWGDWPGGADLGPTFLATSIGGESFAASPSGADQLALLFLTSLGGDEAGIRFSPEYTPETGSMPAITTADDGATRALAVASAPYGHLLATEEVVSGDDGPEHRLHLGLSTEDGGDTIDLIVGGCSPASVHAAATRSGDKVYAALVSAAPYVSAACAWDDPEPATHSIQLMRSWQEGPTVNLFPGEFLSDLGPVTDVAMAARWTGAWLVYRREEAGGRLFALQVDDAANAASAEVEVTLGGDTPRPGTLAATAAGHILFVSWVDTNGSVRVRVLRPDASLAAGIALPPDVGPADGPTSLLGSPTVAGGPDGGAILAWSELQGPGLGRTLRLTRLRCLPPI